MHLSIYNTYTILRGDIMEEDKPLKDVCYELFKETGKINYYMLYNDLKKDDTCGRDKS